MKKEQKTPHLCVLEIEPDSPADKAGLQVGDLLLTINGNAIGDVIDFHFYSNEETLKLEIQRGDLKLTRIINRVYGVSVGVEFENELADGMKTCGNQCVFCFIHQMPKGMRRSLYVTDDDYRLSFLHGNYVSLTNTDNSDIKRIIKQGLSPMYVSVHATDPKLRGYLLGKNEPQPVLNHLKQLARSGIEIHAQIVLCPGLNDGSALEQTIKELAELHPAVTGYNSGVLSTAIVPVGLTQFRQRLYPLKPVTKPYAVEMIKTVKEWQAELLTQIETRFAFLSDEWFIVAEKPFPSRSSYEGYPQYEDGVGTSRVFLESISRLKKSLPPSVAKPVKAVLITGKLPEKNIQILSDELNKVGNIQTRVVAVENHFFGSGITVTGLLTAQDIANTLRSANVAVDETVYIPSICLKDGNLFLDDVTIDELSANLGLTLRAIKPESRSLWQSLIQQ